MKYIISEKHLGLLREGGRVDYLKKAFGVYDPENEMEDVDKKRDVGMFIVNDYPYAQVKRSKKGKKGVVLSTKAFNMLQNADPTENKMYLQWMLNMFAKMLIDGDEAGAWRMLDEDLGMIKEDLVIFNKMTGSNVTLEDEDRIAKALWKTKKLPNSINDYATISDLHAAIQMVSNVDSTDMRSKIEAFVSLKEAFIAHEDSKWLVYVPKSRDASVKVICGAATWCTQQEGNSYFQRYTQGDSDHNRKQRRLPPTAAQRAAGEHGNPSLLFVILNKGLFDGSSDELYQFHFETNQLHDKSNRSIDYVTFLDEHPELKEFFVKGLKRFATADAEAGATGLDDNRYLKYLMGLGGIDDVWEYLPKDATELNLEKMKMTKLDRLENAANAESIFASGVGITEIDSSIGKLEKIEMLMLNNNKLSSLPKEIGQLKTMLILNIQNNNITQLPKEITLLDEENGGSLVRIMLDRSKISNIDEIEEAMPNVVFKG